MPRTSRPLRPPGPAQPPRRPGGKAQDPLARTRALAERRGVRLPIRPGPTAAAIARDLAAWCAKRAAREPRLALLADVAALEAACAALAARPARPVPPSQRPRRAAGVRVVALQHDLLPLWGRRRILRAPRRTGHVALRRGPAGIEAHALDAHDVDLLRLCDGRRMDDEVVAHVAERHGVWVREAQRSLRELRRLELVSSPPGPRRRPT